MKKILAALFLCASLLAGAQEKPKVSGYAITTYKYSTQEGKNGGDGFNARLIRVIVTGKLLGEFDYKFQTQFNGTPHMRDYYVEWVRIPEFKVKVGQFKRPFTFENPTSPWEVGNADYSLGVRSLAAIAADRCGASACGGRDQGIQLQGDILPVSTDGHRLLHYAIGVFNGNGINAADNNADKDIIGSVQIQPVKGLQIGAFGWKGNWKSGGVTVDRNRWSVGAKYDKDGWIARAEYIRSQGHKVSEYDAVSDTWSGTGLADAFYVTCGVPVADKVKVFAAFDQYRDQATEQSRHSIYSLTANLRLHKNLMFQFAYRYNENRLLAKPVYNELWFEAYYRF